MPKQRPPDSYRAEELYKTGMSLVEIAKRLNVPPGTVRRWKSSYEWENQSERSDKIPSVRKEKKERKIAVEETVEQIIENTELTAKQQLFCAIYVRCFNATKAYKKAYGCSYDVANAEGYKLLVNPCVKEEIKRLKQNRLNREMLDESDIFQKYMDIAFADITDFVEFGQEEVPVMAMYGPVQIKDPVTGKKKQITKKINVVRFKESDEVDGTLITEVKQGKDGASIKLADRMKALDWLTEHIDMATEEQKVRIEQIKVKTNQIKGGNQHMVENKVEKLFEAIGGALDVEPQ